jgi:hypothetical protein
LAADANTGAGVQVVGQFAAEGVGLLGHQFGKNLLLLLITELRDVSPSVRSRADQAFLAVALPDAACSRRRTNHDLSYIVAFQAALKKLDDSPPHRQ